MIRLATPEDLPRMETAAGEFFASSRFLRRFELARFVGLWTQLLETGAGRIWLLEESGEIAGALGGVIYPDTYSAERIATEFFWFVREGARGGGLKLYGEFEAWARNLGCSQIRMIHLADSMSEQLGRVYTRLGFELAEQHFTKEL